MVAQPPAADAYELSAVRRASLADQHGAVTVRSSGKLVRARDMSAVGSACRRADLERFHASDDHEPRIDQHQHRAIRSRSAKTASNIQ